jgi:hypothetical protein
MKPGSVLYIQLPVYKGHCSEFEKVPFISSLYIGSNYMHFSLSFVCNRLLYMYTVGNTFAIFTCNLQLSRVGWRMHLFSNLTSLFKTEVPIREY